MAPLLKRPLATLVPTFFLIHKGKLPKEELYI